jgi:hypothetical protein
MSNQKTAVLEMLRVFRRKVAAHSPRTSTEIIPDIFNEVLFDQSGFYTSTDPYRTRIRAYERLCKEAIAILKVRHKTDSFREWVTTQGRTIQEVLDLLDDAIQFLS